MICQVFHPIFVSWCILDLSGVPPHHCQTVHPCLVSCSTPSLSFGASLPCQLFHPIFVSWCIRELSAVPPHLCQLDHVILFCSVPLLGTLCVERSPLCRTQSFQKFSLEDWSMSACSFVCLSRNCVMLVISTFAFHSTSFVFKSS